MKKLIAMAVAILITACITAFATEKNPSGGPSKQFNYQMSFTKVVVADDIDLKLTESNSKIIDITGKDADVENLEWKIKGGILYLRSKKGSLKNKLEVNINVNNLKEITVKGKSTVSSAGALHSRRLYVFLEDDCFVSIKNVGQIYVVNGFDTEVDVKKVVGDVVVAER